MWMEVQVARPGVEHRGESDAGAQMPRICGQGHQRSGGGREDQVEEYPAIPVDQEAELLGHGEDDVEVGYGQDVGHAGLDPPALGQGLALWTVSVATRVIDRALIAAGRAHQDASAQTGGAAGPNRPDSLGLLGCPSQRLPRSRETIEDLGDIEGRTLSVLPAAMSGSHGMPSARALAAYAPAVRTEPVQRTLHRLEVFAGDTRVADGRFDGAVTQQHLDDAEVGTSLQKMGGKTVAQSVRRHPLLDAGGVRGPDQSVTHCPRVNPAPRRLAARKKPVPLWPQHPPVLPQRLQKPRRQHHVP